MKNDAKEAAEPAVPPKGIYFQKVFVCWCKESCWARGKANAGSCGGKFCFSDDHKIHFCEKHGHPSGEKVELVPISEEKAISDLAQLRSKQEDPMQNDAKGFWALIGGMIVAGIAYLAGSKKLIDWLTGLITGRRNDDSK